VIDTHAHVHDRAFDGDRDAVVQRAKEAGVETMVTVGCDLEDSRRAIVAAQHYGIYASVGVHPHEAKSAPPDLAGAFVPLLQEKEAIAIGETGLDFYYDYSPREAQEQILREHIDIARERALPLIFHVRDAHERMQEILREEFAPGARGVIHCFTGNADQANIYVDEFGLFLGIGGVITFKNAQPLRDAIAAVGIDALVLETDCPYLAPVPMRGKRNEPAFLRYTAERVAQVLNVAPSQVIAKTTASARSLFRC
jgi:TatD DNase family protein